MTTTTNPLFQINGALDTSKSVFENLNTIATSAQSFLTWDPELGQWRMIINRQETTVVKAFDDDNIVGGISLNTTGVSDLYNRVKVRFPNRELLGEQDEDYNEVSASARFADEVDNELSIEYSLVNRSQQANRLAQIELKQSRVDTVIQFVTDFTNLSLKAGDVITVTNTALDYLNKKFRVMEISETDDEDGAILLAITALEYDDDVYFTSGLVAIEQNRNVGIVPATSNECVLESDAEAIASTVGDSLSTPEGLENITQEQQYGDTFISIPLFQTETVGWNSSQVAATYGSGSSSTGYLEATIETYRPIKTCYFNFEGPQGDFNYTLDGSTKTITALGIPTYIQVFSREFDPNTGLGIGSFVFKTIRYMEWSSYFTQISLTTDTPTEFLIRAYPLNTYDLSATNQLAVFNSATNFIANANGDYATLSVAAFLN